MLPVLRRHPRCYTKPHQHEGGNQDWKEMPSLRTVSKPEVDPVQGCDLNPNKRNRHAKNRTRFGMVVPQGPSDNADDSDGGQP